MKKAPLEQPITKFMLAILVGMCSSGTYPTRLFLARNVVQISGCCSSSIQYIRRERHMTPPKERTGRTFLI